MIQPTLFPGHPVMNVRKIKHSISEGTDTEMKAPTLKLLRDRTDRASVFAYTWAIDCLSYLEGWRDEGAGVLGQLIKALPPEHDEGLSFDPQHPHQKSCVVVHVCKFKLCDGRQRDKKIPRLLEAS